MRPRVFPAEDLEQEVGLLDGRVASMRPRVFPAEDPSAGQLDRNTVVHSFNEAAGIPRGRRRQSAPRVPRSRSFNEAAGIPRGRPSEDRASCRICRAASMRPRVFPAEDRC